MLFPGLKVTLVIEHNMLHMMEVNKVITHSISNFVYTFVGWVFRIYLLLGDVGLILAPKWPKKLLKMRRNGGVRPLSETVFSQSNSNSNLWCTLVGWVFRSDLLLGHVGQILALYWPKNYSNWVKMVVSDHYLKKCSCNSIQTWCVHLLGECSGLICFRDTLTKFFSSSGQKMTENGGFRPLH